MRKKILMICFGIVVINGIVRAEESVWTCGAFAEGKTGKVTTHATITQHANGKAVFQYQFERPESNQAFIQYPMQTNANYGQVVLPISCERGTYKIEVWFETDKWIYQRNIKLSSERKNPFQIPITGIASDKMKYLKLSLLNRGNPGKGCIHLGKPAFSGKFEIKPAVDGFESSSKWYPVIWQDSDGKKRSSIEAVRKNCSDNSKGCVLSLEYDFPSEQCTQIEMRLPLNLDCEDKEFVLYLQGDGTGNPVEVWCSDKKGRGYFLGKDKNKSQKVVKIGPMEAPDDVLFVDELKLVIVKTKTGKGRVVINQIKLE